MRRPEDRRVRHEDGVAHVDEAGRLRRELHRARDERLGDGRPEFPTELPERLEPDLAVGVHLGPRRDVAEVGVGEPTGPRATGCVGAVRGSSLDLAVGVLEPHALATRDPDAHRDVRATWGIGLIPGAHERVERIPVAPPLGERAGLLAVEGFGAVGHGDQAAGEAVRVLVEDDGRVIRSVSGGKLRQRARGPEEVQGHPCGVPVGRGVHRGVVEQARPAVVGEIGAHEGLGPDRVSALTSEPVVVRGLEVAGRLGESDRRRLEVIVIRVEQVIGLDRFLAAVDPPAVRVVGVPRARGGRGAVL